MKFIPQHDQMDCGAACIAMIADYYGKKYPLQYIRDISFISREGVSLLSISEASKKLGFNTLPTKTTIDNLIDGVFPCILHWNQNHFVVLQKIKKNIFGKRYFYIADPGHGLVRLNEIVFQKSWLSDEDKGVALFLEPTDKFYIQNPPFQPAVSILYLFTYLKKYTMQISILFLLLLLGSALTLVFPFLTKELIDKGVSHKNLNIITLILLTQLCVFAGTITIEIIRNSVMLLVSTKINITIISDFLKKLLKLPIKYFDTKLMGDFNQRIQDHERIENFLSSQSLFTLFSILTFSVFFGVLWYYDFKILLVYITLTILSILWSVFWLKKRKILDYFRFQQRSENQESIYEMINGVTEMKINCLEDFKRQEWENIQYKLLKTNIRILRLDQFQLSGFEFINQLKNIIVTFLAATYVVKDIMTLGALLSISYIIGQMNSPINQLINFFRSFQDAKLSLERLHEIQYQPEEENPSQVKINIKNEKGIILKNVSFQYEGTKSPFVLKNINLHISENKVTAIVGASGSGKTTLMKLLLKFYEPIAGNIHYNEIPLKDISPHDLRTHCGVVMQDGFIFSDSIERNIITGDERPNKERLTNAVKIANIQEFIESLPLKYNTKIGVAGNGISGGQKQRILIARAVYKNPHYIFFDEATSALDAENEKWIHAHLQSFFKNKTVVIIAHRLSTVKNADNIVVLKKGKIVEQGTHQQLVNQQSFYFHLIKNQLELGS